MFSSCCQCGAVEMGGKWLRLSNRAFSAVCGFLWSMSELALCEVTTHVAVEKSTDPPKGKKKQVEL